MQKIADRVLIIGLLTVGTAPLYGAKIIYTVLVGVIYAGFSYSFFDKSAHVMLSIALGIMALAGDLFIPLIPLMLYEACSAFWNGRKQEMFVLGAAAFMCTVLCLVLPDRDFIVMLGKNPFSAAIFGITAVLGVYLSHYTVKSGRLANRNLKIRDDSEEMRRALMMKNELMRQSQNDEIAMATLRERNRIAREIHDNVGHLLSRSILQMGALQTIYKEEPLAASLKQVSATLDESMDNIRRSVHNLHNESFDLKSALDSIIDKNDAYEVNLEYDMTNSVSREIKYTIVSIVTEAFENMHRHSDGTRAWITVMEHPAFYQFIFRDNGHPGEVKESGIGLHNMKSRIDELGGNINFATDRGFKIFANIPKGRNQ